MTRYRSSVQRGSHTAGRVTSVLAVLGVLLSAPASAQTGPTVLVTPFANLSQRAADDWIGVGIAETLTKDLQRAGLLVLGADGTQNADWLIEGGYHRQGALCLGL